MITSELGDELSKLLQLKRNTNEVWGQSPQPPEAIEIWGAKPLTSAPFLVIFEGKSYFNAIGSHFARVQSHLKELDF